MRPLTLRTRTTLLATLVSGLVLLSGAVGLVLTLDARLTTGADHLAKSRVQDLLSIAARGNLPGGLTNVGDDTVAQVVAADDGAVLAASPNIQGKPPIVTFDLPDGLTVLTVRAPDDAETETYRLWTATGEGADGPIRVYVGTSLESVREATHTLRRALVVGVPLGLVVLAAAAWLVLGGALRRIDRIRAEVDDITEDRLDRRVSESGVDDEVGRLAETMNRMLGGLEAAARRQRDFVADVSHDLQSPLAGQRAQIEVAMRSDGALEERLGRELLVSTDEMERLVADLLVLASDDAGLPHDDAGLIDLDVLVLEEVARARMLSQVPVDTSGVSGAPVRAHDSELRRIVRNLLDNAATHAASSVEVRVTNDDGFACLDVLDDGPGVPHEHRDRIFERFHRGDPARARHGTRDRRGYGLGLAIARALAEKTGGTVDLVNCQHGAHFRLRLPNVD